MISCACGYALTPWHAFLTAHNSITILNRESEIREKVMSQVIKGELRAEGLRFAIIASRWNELIVSRLASGAEDAIQRLGGRAEDITLIYVPGSFEIALAAKRCAMSGRFDAIICVGAVIRGETPHFDYIAAEVTKGIATVSLETGVPISYGIITADTVEQAINRAGIKSGNKGLDAAMSAIEMVNLLREM